MNAKATMATATATATEAWDNYCAQLQEEIQELQEHLQTIHRIGRHLVTSPASEDQQLLIHTASRLRLLQQELRRYKDQCVLLTIDSCLEATTPPTLCWRDLPLTTAEREQLQAQQRQEAFIERMMPFLTAAWWLDEDFLAS